MATCSALYNIGTVVTLTATPAFFPSSAAGPDAIGLGHDCTVTHGQREDSRREFSAIGHASEDRMPCQ